MSLGQLRLNLLRVFAAIEKNSKGRFRIIYNLAMQAPSDYYVKLDFDSTEGDTATMPPVLHDVIRDLIANARKYTKPGGAITAGFYASQDELKLVVQDTGRGIPENELTEVVKFGRRGSNVGDVRTMGAGLWADEGVLRHETIWRSDVDRIPTGRRHAHHAEHSTPSTRLSPEGCVPLNASGVPRLFHRLHG